MITSECFVLTNESGSRSFLCGSVIAGGEELRSLVRAADSALSRFKQPTYYTEPRYHVSLASFLPEHLGIPVVVAPPTSTDLVPEAEPAVISASPKSDIIAVTSGQVNLVSHMDGLSEGEVSDDDSSDEEDLGHEIDQILSKLIGISSIECTIGNRRFKYLLQSSTSGFVELFSRKKTRK